MENKERVFSNYGFRNPEKYKWEWHWGSFYGVAYHFLEQVNANEIQNGDVVFYLAESVDDIKKMVVIHAGKVVDGKIISKWGRGKDGSSTNVWSHDVEHVPDSYEDKNGDITVVYFRPNLEEIAAYFLRSCELTKQD